MSRLEENITSENLKTLADCYGNAFYLLDSDAFSENYEELSSAFKGYYPKFNIAYSYKTNYIPKLVKIVDSFGGYAEVVSEMEVEVALRSGVHPSHIIWNGPIKDEKKADQLLIMGGVINIDSQDEIAHIERLAKNHPDHTIHVGLRCNFDVGDGVFSRFGMDPESDGFDQVCEFVKNTPNVHFSELQCHFAKRKAEFWKARTEGMLKTYDRIAKEYDIKPDRIDLGGGIFGKMPESLREQLGVKEYTYKDYAYVSAKIVAEHFNGIPAESKPELVIEPGSAIAGDCMKFVTRIEAIKEIRGKHIATVLGSQKNISMNGLNPPMEVVGGGKDRKKYDAIDITGFTCIESDVLYKDYSGELGIGDFIVISNCGSYSVVMKPPFILPNFPVIDICDDVSHPEVIKRQETFDDLFHTYSF